MADEPRTNQPAKEALGQSEAFLQFMEHLSRVAPVDRPVLLIGERGTGKELAAARLHFLSSRWQSPIVTLNCAALSPSLIESELFGYEPGAFTGAIGRRIGRFEMATGGTLFLDEIANIPMEVQEKILRVVEYGEFERVGGSEPLQVNVRIIGATNVHLPLLVDQGKFKQDLLDRLSFEVLFLPPLKERTGDIMLLAQHFAAHMSFELGLEIAPEFSDQAVMQLNQYPWPGNVRELKNVIERAIYRSAGQNLETIDFDPFDSPYMLHPELTQIPPGQPTSGDDASTQTPPEKQTFAESVQTLKIKLLKDALLQAGFNQKTAAKNMGLTYNQFRGLYRKYQSELSLQ